MVHANKTICISQYNLSMFDSTAGGPGDKSSRTNPPETEADTLQTY